MDKQTVELILLGSIATGVTVCAFELHKANKLSAMMLGEVDEASDIMCESTDHITSTIRKTMGICDGE